MNWYHIANCTATPAGFLQKFKTVYTNCYMFARVADLRIIYVCLTGALDNVGQGWHGDVTDVY